MRNIQFYKPNSFADPRMKRTGVVPTPKPGQMDPLRKGFLRDKFGGSANSNLPMTDKEKLIAALAQSNLDIAASNNNIKPWLRIGNAVAGAGLGLKNSIARKERQDDRTNTLFKFGNQMSGASPEQIEAALQDRQPKESGFLNFFDPLVKGFMRDKEENMDPLAKGMIREGYAPSPNTIDPNPNLSAEQEVERGRKGLTPINGQPQATNIPSGGKPNPPSQYDPITTASPVEAKYRSNGFKPDPNTEFPVLSGGGRKIRMDDIGVNDSAINEQSTSQPLIPREMFAQYPNLAMMEAQRRFGLNARDTELALALDQMRKQQDIKLNSQKQLEQFKLDQKSKLPIEVGKDEKLINPKTKEVIFDNTNPSKAFSDRIAKISHKDFTVDSIQKYRQTGNDADLVRLANPENFQKRFKNEKDVRDGFRADSKNYVITRNGFLKVQASAVNPSPAGDLSMIFGYMKVLDPTSVVKETEQSMVQHAGAFGDKVESAVSQIVSGVRLTATQRADFLSRSEMLFKTTQQSQDGITNFYRAMAKRYGLDERNIIVDYAGNNLQAGQKIIKNPQSTAGLKVNDVVDGLPKTANEKDEVRDDETGIVYRWINGEWVQVRKEER